MSYLSADYSNNEQLVFCDENGNPVDSPTGEFMGVRSRRSQEVVEQFSEINPHLIELASRYEAEPAEELPEEEAPINVPVVEPAALVAEPVEPEPVTKSAVAEAPMDGPDVLLAAGVPEDLVDELLAGGVTTVEELLARVEAKTLTSVKGIGPASEKRILAGIAK